MARRPGLGKGLDALIPGGLTTKIGGSASNDITKIPIQQISPNPRQPRREMDPEDLQDLSQSIKTHGILQPLIVAQGDSAEEFTLIAGERRWRAAQLAGLSEVPVIIRSVSDQERLELALIENIQRSDLNALDQAYAYQQLVDEFSLTHEEIATSVGKSRTTITNVLRLLNLSDRVKQALRDGKISEGHARTLLSLSNQKGQESALETITGLGLNVRQSEALVSKLLGRRAPSAVTKARVPEIVNLEDRLRNHFKTKVNLNSSKRGGNITIYFFSDEELNAILDQIF